MKVKRNRAGVKFQRGDIAIVPYGKGNYDSVKISEINDVSVSGQYFQKDEDGALTVMRHAKSDIIWDTSFHINCILHNLGAIDHVSGEIQVFINGKIKEFYKLSG